MNILILEEAEVGARLPRSDRRWAHVKKVLRKGPGDRLAAALVVDSPDSPPDGSLGEGIVRALDDTGLVLDFEAFEGSAGLPPPLAPLRLVLGFPRPIQAARILKELTSLGVEEIHLTGTQLGEKSYAQSSIFRDRDFRSSLIEGAEQAGNPRLPRVFTHWSLQRCLDDIASGGLSGAAGTGDRIFLHPYGSFERMGDALPERGPALRPPVYLAVGSERGWTEAEVAALAAAGFAGRSLGDRILKTETAALAACVLALASLHLL